MSVTKYFNCSVVFIFVVLLVGHQVACKRGGSNKRPRTTARTTSRPTHHHETAPYQANNYQVGNSPPPPLAPIGFDNVNRQSSSNSHPIGFENVQRTQQGYQPPPNTGINTGYHPPQQQFGGYNPQVPQGQPPGTWGHPAGGYNPQGSHFGGYTPHGGGYNPYLSQPGSYYQNYATPGIQPQFYQPAQQSSGFGAGSLLGIAGSFGGGYLLGRLTSGGHDHKESSGGNNKEGQEFVVHHYYHNSQEIPKQITVSNDSVVTCMQNVTQHLCVPNTFPMCLSNGTIMCVTHTRFTVPCGANNSISCIITALPCANNKDNACNSASNLSNTVVYVPCISNVTISGQNVTVLGNNTDLCITAIAEPAKKLQSPVPSLFNLINVLSTLPFELQKSMNFSSPSNATVTTVSLDIKTEMPPTKVSDS